MSAETEITDEQLAQSLELAWCRETGRLETVSDQAEERDAWLAVARKARELLKP
jgi:hypothetical protein